MKRLALLLSALIASSASAQEITGMGTAIDGDSVDMAGIIVRLHGIDAPEYRQTCERAGVAWACGKAAAEKLAALTRGAELHCQQRDVDRHGRIVASCRAGSQDLAAALIDAGLAVALPQYSDRYLAGEARARSARAGIWASTFEQPADYRAAHQAAQPRAAAGPAAPRPVAPQASASGRLQDVYYPNCKAARAAGAAPLRRGQPGYRPEMDGDGDGIACEPYYGR